MLNGRDIKRRLLGGATDGLIEAAELLMHAAAVDAPPEPPPDEDPDPLVSLRESGHIEIDKGGRSVVVSFDTPYAAKVHEDQHLKHPRGGGPKYLEKNAKALIPTLDKIVGSEVRKNMTGDRRSNRRRPRRA